MKKQNKNPKVISTKRNKGIEPISANRFIIGYNEEIHSDDSIEFSYKLPLGAIKRLIKSYHEDLLSIYQDSTYLGQSGSWEIRMLPYCHAMLSNIEKQLNECGLNGNEICKEVFDKYFKAHKEQMDRYIKNHGKVSIDDCKPCKDPECCCKDNQKL